MADITSLQQIQRAQLQGHQVQHSDARHVVIIDGVIVSCTPTEYILLMPLLSHAGEVVPFAHLLGLPDHQPLTRSTRRSLTQHLSRLRARLWPFSLDILCLNGYGYLLFARSNENEQAVGT
jgi:DNA-binding response OmpR family regulator